MRLRRSLTVAAGLVATAALALAGCSSSTSTADGAPSAAATSTSGATDSFPVTVESALGDVTIESEPQRVATWGWGSTEAAIAVGVYPVAVAEQRYTVGEGALLPWVEEAYDEAGVEHPTLLTDDGSGSQVPYEEFVAARPDLILAPYSGLSQEQYDLLSDIAPVVAYPEAPWATEWDQEIEIVAQALGRTQAGDEVLDGIRTFLSEQADAHPEFEGKTFAGIWDGDGSVSVYTPADPRVNILEELGLRIAPAVSDLDTSDGGFYYDLPDEQLDKLQTDFVVSYSSTKEDADAVLTAPELQMIPAVKEGKVVQVYDPVTVSSVSPPTALTFTWEGGLPTLIERISETVS
ncbi:iron-siderophore ABC transporter substrate-binding protein [Xylanimonas oleitrophica]|uniref:Iron-siderophore ABC transporter substrate-binding protein n=1 Tax=Xylanimonas oleitrophica TaxID=2607479 RepID=A0A2W5YGL6_9MICO|nr:iron-siderophore ABC transporter substrate-binding protein [Xylanimonas oleitrophica]PZR53891.1 iron-siderophore ABC transporter substrate-binding protein [Xylanimonas oleitrophica]